MTNKDYVMIASILREFGDTIDDPSGKIDHIWLTEKFAKMLKIDDPSFSVHNFYIACGLKQQTSAKEDNISPDKMSMDEALGQSRN